MSVVVVARRRDLALLVVELLDLFVDDLLELLEGLRADEAAAVDEEVRGAGGLDVLAELGVRVDLLLVLLVLDRSLHLVDVEAQVGGGLLEVSVLELRLRSRTACRALPRSPVSPF